MAALLRTSLILAGFLLSACSAADPGVEGLTRPLGGADGGTVGDGGKPGDGGAGGSDAGSEAAAPSGAFTGAGAYASQQPAQTAAMYHNDNNVGVTPGKGTACLSCHKQGGSGTEFLFAGTIFQDKAGTMPAADVEVRVRGIDGSGFLSHSDADGNFWFKKGQNDNLQFPAQTGARDTAQTALMGGSLTATDCNGCHSQSTDALHLP